MWGGWPRGSEFLQLSPLASIIAGAARVLRLRLGYSQGSFRFLVSGFQFLVCSSPAKTREPELETRNQKLETGLDQLPPSIEGHRDLGFHFHGLIV
jgi:hypothetical protein